MTGNSSARKPVTGDTCKVHVSEELRFFCVPCDTAVCIYCKLTRHELHTTEDLSTAAETKKKELTIHKARLQRAVAIMTERVNATKMEQKALLDKEEAVKRNIRERHATIVAAADKFRDEALKSVSSVNADIKSRIDKVLKQQEKNLGKLVEIQQNLDQTVRRGTSGDVIAVTKEMRNGCGSEDSVGRLMTTQEIEGFFRPVLRFSVTADVMVQKVHDFLGTVSKVHIEAEAPEVKVVERFRCWKEANTEIFSLCHVDGNAPGVWVSYERCNLRKDAPVAKFDEHGTYLSSSRHSLGKISHRRYAKGLFMRTTSQEGKMSTFSKSICGNFQTGQRLLG